MQPELTPEQPRWYLSPREVVLKLEVIKKGPFEEEVAILIRLNGESKTAFVPLSEVDEDKKTVRAFALGEIGNLVLVELPSGSMGKTLLQMNPVTLKEIEVAK